ncbi:MAG: hypothetical protein LBJ00_08000 [Planctomycetaceae bacterium]|jgi:hypothetical protein|nr:hypothetical protein [Planctomycetaceae bacterium]
MDSSSAKTINRWYIVGGYFDSTLTWFFGIVMLAAAIPHWENPYYFLGSVYDYKLVDPGLGQMVAILLPFIQLILSILLLARILTDVTHLACMFLFLCFAVVQTVAFFQGLDIPCGCFGPNHETTIEFQTLFLIYSLTILSVTRNLLRFLISRQIEIPRRSALTT